MTDVEKGNETPSEEITVFNNVEYKFIQEGQAKVLYPLGNQVFYNPVQQFNRDMSILCIKTFIKDYKTKCKHHLHY